jgi:hypothetical protein
MFVPFVSIVAYYPNTVSFIDLCLFLLTVQPLISFKGMKDEDFGWILGKWETKGSIGDGGMDQGWKAFLFASVKLVCFPMPPIPLLSVVPSLSLPCLCI